MHRSPRVLTASVALLATLSLAACGDDDDAASTTTAPAATTTAGDGTEVTSGSTAATDTTTGSSAETTTAGTGGGEVGEQSEYVDTAREEFADDFDDDGIAECVAEALVSDDVYAAIQDAGLTLETFQEDGPSELGLDEAVAGDLAADMAACGDLIPQVFAEDEQACAEESLTNDQLAEFLAFTLVGTTPTEEMQTAVAAVEECIAGATTTT